MPTSVKKGRKGARTGASRRSRPPLPGDRRRRNQRRGGEEEEDEWDDAVSSDEEPQAAGGEEKERASPQPSTESVEATDANPAATSGKKRASDDDANVNLKGASGIVKKTGAFSPPPAPSSVASSHSRRSVGVTSAQPLQPPNVPTQPQFDLQSLVRVPASAVTVCERCSPTTRMRPPLSVSPSHAHPVSVSEYQGEDSRRYIVQRVLVPSPTRGASRGVSSSSPSAAWPSTAPSSVSVDRPPSVMQAHASGKKIKLRLVRVKRVRVPRGSSGISLPTGTTAPPPPPLTSSPPPHSYYY